MRLLNLNKRIFFKKRRASFSLYEDFVLGHVIIHLSVFLTQVGTRDMPLPLLEFSWSRTELFSLLVLLTGLKNKYLVQ